MLTVTDVLTYLHIHPITVYRMIAAGKLHPIKIGRVLRFNRDEIEELAKRREQTR